MEIQLVGHAAMLISLKNAKILVDPVLNWIGSLLLVNQNSALDTPGPEPLPINEVDFSKSIQNLDAVVYTNAYIENHPKRAYKKFANNVPILCHGLDEKHFSAFGFRNVIPVKEPYRIKDLSITSAGTTTNNFFLTTFQSVHGFIIHVPGEPKIYLAGISKWNMRVRDVIEQNKPDLTIFSANSIHPNHSSRFSEGYVKQLKKQLPESMMMVMNMESGNHCLLAKKELDIYVKENTCRINLI